jgi:glucose/arabinose dehydrogenase
VRPAARSGSPPTRRWPALAAVCILALAGSCCAGAAAAERRIVQVGTFASPVYLTAPRSEPGRLYVVEQAGRIVRVAGGRRTTFLDIRNRVLAGGEQGLLSVAFHPRYAKNGLFYVDYTAAPNGNTVIAEYRARGAKKPVRTRVLMNLPDPAANHNGGQLVFGPDGYLWWGNGDGGGAGDQFGNGQRAGGHFAKIMRLDVSKPKARWRTWAVGLRNPWRFSFDRKGGALYIADVGQNAWEEVDYVPRGRSHLNFGWNRYEGNARYGDEQLLPGWTLTPPVHVYDHNEGCSITGGYVYRGKQVASATGRYFFGDYCSGRVWSLRVVNGKATDVTREPFDVPDLSSFGEDARGELYLLSLRGPVYRLAA